MHNHEYGLAIPLARLYEYARHPGPECTPGHSEDPPCCALRTVEEMLCPCIRGDRCVCHALARELEICARRARGGNHADMKPNTS